jgi:ABC-type transport system involved in cytochrome c biogenesis permease subunit
MGIAATIAAMRREESSEKVEKIYTLRVVALGGALASFCAALAANYAPFPRDIQALMPVLRSNFWLGIHVLTITTSYACTAAAWLIGNLALGYYLFGRYRTVAKHGKSELLPPSEGATNEPGTAQPTALEVAAAIVDPVGHLVVKQMTRAAETVEPVEAIPPGEGERRPPAFCGTLANLNYRVMQVAVLLIAAGTILGGLWADVSWGRFWGWDPKEVGALIALLILLTALHGRRAGWPGDLSLAIGSVFGFFGVLWAWYVVNFLLNAGMHSYGAGEGGQWLWLVAVVGGQLAFIVAAVMRVSAETGKRAA